MDDMTREKYQDLGARQIRKVIVLVTCTVPVKSGAASRLGRSASALQLLGGMSRSRVPNF